jgi:TonB family protein
MNHDDGSKKADTMDRSKQVDAPLGALVFATLALTACGADQPVEQPTPLYGENPIEYPLELWDQGVEGEAVLRVLVNEAGDVDSVEVVQPSGHEGLDAAAVAGARDLRFSPARSDGKRTSAWARVPVRFSKKPRTRDPGGSS